MLTEKCFTAGSDFPPPKDGTLRLYSMRFCPYAHRTRLVLAHKNIQYETVNISLSSKPQWFLDRNPLAAVPVLEQGDKIVYESAITVQYLDDVYQGNKLTPSDPYIRACDRMLMERYGKVTSAFYKTLRCFGAKDEAGVKESIEEYHKALEIYEQELEKRGTELFGGDDPSLIDYILWPHIERASQCAELIPTFAVSPERTPKMAAWVNRMNSLPAVKETKTPTDMFIGFIKSFADGKSNYDFGLN